MKKLSETEKLKYWVDAEFTLMHVYIAVILYQLVTSNWQKWALVVYGVYSLVYAITRVSYIITQDKDYLKVPKK